MLAEGWDASALDERANMRRKVDKVGRLRLSPNEEARLIREEQERRRRLRLQQVREQERFIALQIRKEVRQRRDCELQGLAEELRGEWVRQQEKRVQALQELYEESRGAVGESYRSAKENEPDWEALVRQAGENQERAERRHRAALTELRWQRERQQEEQCRRAEARKRAMLTEKERAAKVTSLPPPPPDPIQNVDLKRPPVAKVPSAARYSVTHYHLPEATVDCEVNVDQRDARLAAAEEGRRLAARDQEEERERRERQEKARLRGECALRKEHLAQDRERLLQQLDRLQQADLLRRRQQLAHMALNIFQPPHRRQEMAEERQWDLETAFEDLYAGERGVKGDQVLHLVPEPLPATSLGSQDEDLDVTLEPSIEEATDREESQPAVPPAEEQAQPSEAPPRDILKKLLERIRAQRTRQGSRSGSGSEVTAGDSVTMESGSLSSENREQARSASPTQITEPDPQPAAQVPGREATEDSSVAETLRHHRGAAVQAERRMREAELERQKQEQLKLLEDLEEQRRGLELQLRQARLSAEDSGKFGPAESPADFTESQQPSTGQESQPIAAQDARSRRIREHQRRLLEQNRLHQQSVDQARRRLEEYQGLLKMKYPSMGLQATLPLPPRGGLSALTAPPATLISPLPFPGVSQDCRTPTPPLVPDTISQSDHPEGALSDLPTRDSPSPASEIALPSLIDGQPARTIWPTGFMAVRTGGGLEANLLVPEYRAVVAPQRLGRSQLLGERESVPDQTPPLDTPTQDKQELGQSHVVQGPRGQTGQTIMEWAGAPQPAAALDQQEALGGALLQQQSLEQMALQEDRDEEDDEARLSWAQLSSTLMSASLEAVQKGTFDPTHLNGDVLPTPSSSTVSNSVTHRDLKSAPCLHTPKPPVARPRLGILEMIEQHELSAIQEVETPANGSLATVGRESPEKSFPITEEARELEGLSHTGRRIYAGPARGWGSSSCPTGTSSVRRSWRDWLQMEAGLQLQPDPAPARVPTDGPCPPEYRRAADTGADVKCGGVLLQGPPQPPVFSSSPSLVRLHTDPEFSTSISTGSFSTTEPDLSSGGTPPCLSAPASRLAPEVSLGNSASISPASCGSISHDCSVQRIIDKYIKELNDSLFLVGSSSVPLSGRSDFDLRESSCFMSLPGSRSQQNLVRVSGAADSEQTLRSQGSLQDSSISTPGQMLCDSSSSYLQEAHDVGLGSVSHSSSNRFLPLEPTLDSDSSSSSSSHRQGVPRQIQRAEEWDSAMRRIIQHLSDHSSSQCQGEGTDSRLSLLISQLLSQSSSWLEGDASTSRENVTGGCGVQSLLPADTDSTGPLETSGDVIRPESCRPEHFPLVEDSTPEHRYGEGLQPDLQGQDTVLLGEATSDSFHPLLAETTANETAEQSLSFHPPSKSSVVSRSPDPHWDLELSPECLRNESAGTSQCSPPPLCGSILLASPRSSVCDLALAEDCPPQPDSPLSHDLSTERGHLCKHDLGECDSHRTFSPHIPDAQEPQENLVSGSGLTLPIWDRILETDQERGILEEPELTLVSLGETTLQEEGVEKEWTTEVEEECTPFMLNQARQTCKVAGDDSNSKAESETSHAVAPLQAQASGGTLQELFLQKRQDFIRKSTQRQEKLKARRSAEMQARADRPAPTKGPRVKPPQDPASDVAPRAAGLELKKVAEVTVFGAEQRRAADAEMYQRTERYRQLSLLPASPSSLLYNKLEEVRRHKEASMRQEAYAKNRARAKEFHKKTLLQLRTQRLPV
ncbi:uncharacterized protein cep295 isoform X2 [Brienomyrus brachyistius]|uniref:uncharacterized protein cep295 isoform X2 n=1 Tax=Brienomyrus brachyistius TaxID=42636 RepID=UPI0020B2562F|nr:uncharacterized protein cep295 isoform X2 [Brienomyrus brachyistius]